jgi:stage II sporulation protein D
MIVISKNFILKLLRTGVLILLIQACIPQVKEKPIPSVIPKVKVLISTITLVDSLQFDGIYFMETEEARYEFGTKNNNIFIALAPNGYKVYNENRMFLFRKSDIISFIPDGQGAHFFLNKKKYNGTLKIIQQDSLNIYLVNELDVETYLKGVVPAEIFTNQEILTEAVKAQAVCARSYVLKKMEQNVTRHFHVYADVRDQAYGGQGIRTALGDLAVTQTSGSILMYGTDVADIYYHASCGGVLECAENVWPGRTKIYLQTHQDVMGKQFADIESPYFRWKEERTITQLDSLFFHNFGVTYLHNSVTDTVNIPLTIEVQERYHSGRVKKLVVEYGTVKQELSNYKIRSFLGWPPGKLLKSTLINFTATDSSLIINGAGNGHGVGMCQFGAMFKAKNGLQYYHILQSYFPGTTLKKIY